MSTLFSDHGESGPSRLFLIALVLFATSVVSFHDFSYPLYMLDGAVSNAFLLADQAGEGSILRRISIPLIGLLGAYLLLMPRARRFSFASPLSVALIAYVAWIVLSLSWSDDPELTFRRLFVFLFLLLGAVGMASLDARSILRIFIWISLATLALGLANELYLGTFAPWRSGYRFSGTVHPNLQGASMAQLALTGLCCMLDPEVRKQWLGPLLLGLGTLVVLMTQSRTSLISLVVSSLFVIVLWARGRTRQALLATIAIAAVVGALVVLILALIEMVNPDASPIALVLSTLTRPRDQGNIGALTGRTDIWATCIRMAMEHPLTGFGFESFWTPARIVEISALHRWGINQSHSVYIEHLVSLGIVGLLLWCGLILGGLVTSVRNYAVSRSGVMLWIAAQIVFCIVHGISESINTLPLFNGFILVMMIAHLALFRKEVVLERSADKPARSGHGAYDYPAFGPQPGPGAMQ